MSNLEKDSILESLAQDIPLLNKTSKLSNKIKLFGKYKKVKTKDNDNSFINELVCSDLTIVSLIDKRKNKKTELIDGYFYNFIGKFNIYPDTYSEKAKLFLQFEFEDVEFLEKNDEIRKYIEARNKIAEKRNRKKLFTEKKIEEIISSGKKLNFLYIVSKKGNFQKSDILNDLYDDKYKKNEMSDLFNYYGIDFINDKNTLRVQFSKEGWESAKKEIQERKSNYSALVFIKGGGATSFFDDEVFCSEVLDMDIPFITAIGHSLDNEKLLCQLADENFKTPTYLGRRFLNFIYKSRNENKVSTLTKKLRVRNIILLFLIPLIILFNMVYLYFSNSKKELKTQKETIKEEIKKDNQSVKEDKNNLIEKVQEKISKKVEDKKIVKEEKKETIKLEKKKRLIYSEDDVYTVLLWKGYKGEKAISDFQRDNGMKITGKVDEALLKKLGVKYRFD